MAQLRKKYVISSLGKHVVPGREAANAQALTPFRGVKIRWS
jgi:hypothetical protein